MASGRETARSAENCTLLAVVLLDSFSYALILPILPFLIFSVGGDAALGGLVVGAHALSAAVAAPLLGKLSDRIGSKPVLVGTLVVAAISYALLSVAQTMPLLLLSRVMSGAVAGNIGVAQAALARRVPVDARSRVMQLFTAAWALGFVVGPAMASVIPVPPARPAANLALIAAVGAVVAALSAIIFLRHTVRSSERKVANGGTTGKSELMPLFMLTAIVATSQTGLISVTGFFANAIYGWGPVGIGRMMLGCAVAIVIVQLAVLPFLTRRFGTSAMLTSALAAGAFGCLVVSILPQQVFATVPAIAMIYICIPISQTALATMMSRSASDDEQGAVLGTANGIAAVGRVLGPLAFGWSFATLGMIIPFVAVMLLMIAGASRSAHLARQ